VQIEQVRGGGPGEQLHKMVVGQVAFLEPGPEGDHPGSAPARAAPAVGEAVLQRPAGRLRQARGVPGRDLIAGVEREQMRQMPVSRFRLAEVLPPLLQASIGGDPRLVQAAEGVAEPRGEVRVSAQLFTRGQAVREQVADQPDVHGGRGADPGLLAAARAEQVFR
jgi:hypothetical protein